MQMADAVFEAVEGCGRFFSGDVHFFEIVGVRGLHQARAPDDGTVAADSAPEIGEIHGVEGFSFGEADRGEDFFADWPREHGEREARMHAG